MRVSVRCSACRGVLARGAAAYCAACLSPHDAGCFAALGGCSAARCDETRMLTPEAIAEAKRAPRILVRVRRSRRWRLVAAAYGIVDLLGQSQFAADAADRLEGARLAVPIRKGQVFQRYHFASDTVTK